MGCRFCASTQAGRVRDLTAGEIAAEIYTAQKDTGERVSHIVLMGIGEPLHNFNNVMDFLEIISCSEGVNIGMRNIQPVDLRPCAQDRRAGEAPSAADTVCLAPCAGQ